jgi:hypothetical protein
MADALSDEVHANRLAAACSDTEGFLEIRTNLPTT